MIYYVQIPCCVTRDRPNRTAATDRWLIVPIEADSPAKALESAEKALTVLVQEWPRPIGY